MPAIAVAAALDVMQTRPAGCGAGSITRVALRSAGDYWNHNTAFHDEILHRSAQSTGDMLDIGCGDGLLLARLARTERRVVGIDPDAVSAYLARARCEGLANVTVLNSRLEDADLEAESFGFVTMVATLHHMDTASALDRCAKLLRSGGRLYVLGLTRIGSRADLAHAVASLPRARIVGALRNESWLDGVPTVEPRQTFGEVRQHVTETLPGARVRRRPYYRYSLEWLKP